MFNELNVPILGVIENMSYLEMPDGTRMEVFGRGGGEMLAQNEGVPFLGAIPMDPAVRKGGDDGKPVIVSHPQSAPAQALRSLAEQLAARLSVNAYQNQPAVTINVVG